MHSTHVSNSCINMLLKIKDSYCVSCKIHQINKVNVLKFLAKYTK